MHAINPPALCAASFTKVGARVYRRSLLPALRLTYGANAGLVTGLEGARKLFTPMLATAPDVQGTIEDMVAEGEKVAVHWTFRGTHTGESPLTGAPTGAPFTLVSMSRSTDPRMARSRKTGVWTRNGRPGRSGSDEAVAKAKGIQYGIALFRLGWDPSQTHNERKR